jgi:negative regulator of flagellin synthesis FlgM
MKIDNTTRLPAPQVVKDARPSLAKKASNAQDEVQLSGTATELLAPESEAPFDAGRVQEIKQAIAEGKFSINAGAIADRLIATAKELLDSPLPS